MVSAEFFGAQATTVRRKPSRKDLIVTRKPPDGDVVMAAILLALPSLMPVIRPGC
jgi:hypothetical protein